ncbi:hypothetical protein ACN27F_06560 [Solwaraspora sp. WMMB335]|uniref:hypothetical protein n=1 Tax=Solwaraspora sp. WMMB335 TaxID=3404118 RepID=UPI003B947B76
MRTLSRGIPLAHGETQTIVLDGKEHPSAVRREDRFRMVRASNAVIVMIGLLYVALVTILLLP